MARARQLLTESVTFTRTSSLYDTAPLYETEQPRFLNQVCCGETHLSPAELLSLIHHVERALGRPPGTHNAPRTIDIDILFYGRTIITIPQLVIPHPGISERAFVLVPLAEIAPELKHPASGLSIAALLEKVKGKENVLRIRQGEPV
jgi:2-amino-4-hydroxy-6-hydroxymethyldihydropteridine diphosphokinase